MSKIVKDYNIETFRKIDSSNAIVKARILPATGEVIQVIKGRDVVLSRELLDKIVTNYNNSLRRFLKLGKLKYPDVYIEHIYTEENKAGRLNSEMSIEKHLVRGRFVDCIVVELKIVDRPDIVSDLEKKGKQSRYAMVSVGVSFAIFERPELYEVSLTDNPACEEMMMLNKEKSKHSKEIDRLMNEIKSTEHELEEATMKLNIKNNIVGTLKKGVATNRIDYSDARKILERCEFSHNENKIITNMLTLLPKAKFNTKVTVRQ